MLKSLFIFWFGGYDVIKAAKSEKRLFNVRENSDYFLRWLIQQDFLTVENIQNLV